jgi:hypothetical protein
MGAPEIRAVDQNAAHAHVAHLAEGDLLRPHLSDTEPQFACTAGG